MCVCCVCVCEWCVYVCVCVCGGEQGVSTVNHVVTPPGRLLFTIAVLIHLMQYIFRATVQCALPPGCTVFVQYRGTDKSLARPGSKTSSEACQGRARFQQHRDTSCHQVFLPARQGAEINSRHSDRNISLFPSWSG